MSWLQLRSIRKAYNEELKFFLSYHRNRVNWMIHAITIPLEWTSWLLFLTIFRIHWLIAVPTAVYFVILDSPMSLLAAVAQIFFCWFAQYIYQITGLNLAIGIVVFVQLSSWFLQVYIGHKVFEKNLPAMATKLTCNSIILSPLLAWDYIAQEN